MSDFLQSLVLRAAGLPPAATPAPRGASAQEPIEAGGLEEVAGEIPVGRAAAQAAAEPQVRAPQGESVDAREMPVLAAPRTDATEPTIPRAPEPVLHERRDITPAAMDEHERAPEPGIVMHDRETVREVVRESRDRQPIVEHQETIAQPPPAPLSVPRETVAARPAPPAPEAPRETPEPVLLQPIIVEQTKTIVEPVRERETVVATHTEHTIETRAEKRRGESRDETPDAVVPTPRTESVPVIGVENTQPPRTAQAAPAPEPRTPTATTSDEPLTAEPPPVLVQPKPPEPAPELAQAATPQPTEIHIGTIEIRAAAPPPAPPPAAPPPVYVTRDAEPQSGFDDYARVRSYAFPDLW